MDDAAPPSLGHALGHQLAQAEEPPHIGGPQPVQLGQGNLQEGVGVEGRGVVHQHADRPQPGLQRRQLLLQALHVAHVRLPEDRPAPFRLDGRQGLLGAGRVRAEVHDHLGPGLGEGLRGGPTDAPRGAGDQNDLGVEWWESIHRTG